MGNKRNICILTTQRSGSTWLMQLLNDTGKVRAFGEVFLEWARVENHPGDKRLLPPLFYGDFVKRHGSRSVSAFLDELESADERPIAFKIMYDQVKRNPAILLMPVLRGYTIVHLRRRNLLDVVISRLLARTTRVYHSATVLEQPKVRASAESVMAMLKRIDWQMRLAKAMLALLPIRKLDLAYEDLATRPATEVERLLAAIGLRITEFQQAGGNWIKTNRRRPEQVFADYDTIASRLQRSRFGWMLEGRSRNAAGRSAPGT